MHHKDEAPVWVGCVFGAAALGPRSTDTSPNKFFFTVKVVIKLYLNTVGACLSQLVDPKVPF